MMDYPSYNISSIAKGYATDNQIKLKCDSNGVKLI